MHAADAMRSTQRRCHVRITLMTSSGRYKLLLCSMCQSICAQHILNETWFFTANSQLWSRLSKWSHFCYLREHSTGSATPHRSSTASHHHASASSHLTSHLTSTHLTSVEGSSASLSRIFLLFAKALLFGILIRKFWLVKNYSQS